MSYFDVALTQTLYDNCIANNQPIKQGVRFKILKATGQRFPDIDTTKITKIDADGNYDIQTDIGSYIKIMNDDFNNRTFILHEETMDTTTAVVSVVNHSLDSTDADFVEAINKNTSSGWDTDYDALIKAVYDMHYDKNTNQLAIACKGTATKKGALFIINMQKYIADLQTNTCSTLKDNPDYLNCTVMDLDDYGAADSYIKFVDRYGAYWYTWAYTISGLGARTHVWELGRFNDSGTYELLFVWGQNPTTSGNPNTDFNENMWCPDSTPFMRDMSAASGSLYWNDPAACFDDVKSFHVNQDSGEIIISNSPDSDIAAFGVETFLYRIDIAELVAGEQEITSSTVERPSYYDAGSGRYKVDAEWIEFSIDTSGFNGYLRIDVTNNHTGDASFTPQTKLIGNAMITSSYGTIQEPGITDENGEPHWHTCIYVDESTSSVEIAMYLNAINDLNSFTLRWTAKSYTYPAGLQEIVGDSPQIKQSSDTYSPTRNTYTYVSRDFQLADRVNPSSPEYTVANDCYYSSSLQKYAVSVLNESNVGDGIYIIDKSNSNETTLTRIQTATTDLEYNQVREMLLVSDRYIIITADDYAGAGSLSELYVQTVNLESLEFGDKSFLGDNFYSTAVYGRGILFSPEAGRVGFCTGPGLATGTLGEIWFWEPDTVSGEWSRNPRVYWDGSEPDYIMGATGESYFADDLNQNAMILAPSLKESKGQSSKELTFGVSGIDYLPWQESKFNENPDFADTYDGTLQHGTRIIMEHGIFDGHDWTWIQEGLFYVVKSPLSSTAGMADMSIVAQGVISMIVTRSVYEGYHAPDINEYNNVTLSTDDDLTYYYDDGGLIQDWCTNPQIKIYVDGETAKGYNLNLTNGTITFYEAQTGSTVTASFSAYESGTNEVEDIVICILIYPNYVDEENEETVFGCELDETFITRNIEGETLTSDDGLTYSFSKNMIRYPDDFNKIYIDGIEATEGVDYDWNLEDFINGREVCRDGTLTFSSDQSGSVITGDCTYFTIQKSGITLGPLNFVTRDYATAYDCINEAVRRTNIPNYIFREGLDGKPECDFFTQKSAGEEDIVIDESDVVIYTSGYEPVYDNLSTACISFGQANLEELPNLALGKTVTDLFPYALDTDPQFLTDGNTSTQLIGGYGRWDEGTYTAQAALLASGDTGIPFVSIDLESVYEVATIIIARGSQRSNEGDKGTVFTISVDGSQDGSSWERLVNQFSVVPGGNIRLTAGTNYEEGTKFQYIRINAHSLGLYDWEGHTDSQVGLSEVQCFENEIIEGIAYLQTEDAAEPLYDNEGLLDKYGYIVHVARGGQPDSALNTQDKADTDARYTLEEIVDLVNQVNINAAYLPGVPIFSTIKVDMPSINKEATFFIETRTTSMSGFNLTGKTLT